MTITQLDLILQSLYNPKVDLILCGDININYLIDNDRVRQVNAVLNSYNLVSIVTFPTRIRKDSNMAIDNIFIDTTKFHNYKIFPLLNGLSDHDAQLLTINISSNQPQEHQTYFKRKINKYTITEFQVKLSYETWDSVFHHDDVNTIFNSFLNTYLRIFCSSFPLTKVKRTIHNTSCITQGIKISCKHKRELYITCRNSNSFSTTKNIIKIIVKFCQGSLRQQKDYTLN
jgi:hypothetical protein